ncbi:MAG: DoxX family membrane protein [Bacteroidetes bacterium]|uniref:DoxX family membrane protein n=1 Tax=Candidatus Cryptobacteroides intestinavium TaxID=2840766 RepID=A0A9D9HJ30_9BACT|nr:DoxX family membrane protein [Candidatus Cryptobacteroides intestinavium]
MGISYNRIRRFCAFIIGAVFFVSGLLKLLDPVGAGLVIGEYYRFFGTEFMLPSSKPVGFVLAMLETLLGAALMTGLWRRIIAILTIVFLCGFTILTVFLVIYNPEMDCGCFGEAVHLTHSQTFIKNVALCALAVIAFTPLTKLGRPKRRKYVSFGIVSAAVVGFGIYSLLYIPLVDFTDFKPASRLEAAVQETSDMYDAIFIYEKDGEQKSFSLDNLPDSTWTYVSTETVRDNAAGEVNPSLSFTDADGGYRDYLAASGKVLVLSIYDMEAVPERRWEALADIIPMAFDAGYYPLVLFSGDYASAASYIGARLDADAARIILDSSYFADRKTIMTLNRSNGGATYFHDGYLVRKWASRNLPSENDLARIALDYVDEAVVETTTAGHIGFQAFLVGTFAVILFV